jgi:hypothetical protein
LATDVLDEKKTEATDQDASQYEPGVLAGIEFAAVGELPKSS